MARSKPLSALSAPAFQDQSTGLGTHTLAKAMSLRPTTIIRLKGSLHYKLPVSKEAAIRKTLRITQRRKRRKGAATNCSNRAVTRSAAASPKEMQKPRASESTEGAKYNSPGQSEASPWSSPPDREPQRGVIRFDLFRPFQGLIDYSMATQRVALGFCIAPPSGLQKAPEGRNQPRAASLGSCFKCSQAL